ncbi:MAG: M43 family zinc metalloprotease [Bacteroidota bacterium]
MMYRLILIYMIFFMTCGMTLLGQKVEEPCGTRKVIPLDIPSMRAPPPVNIANQRRQAKQKPPFTLTPSELTFNIKFHRITTETNPGPLDITSPIRLANNFFKQGGIQFSSNSQVNHIPLPPKDSVFDIFKKASHERIRRENEEPNAINIFVVPYLITKRRNRTGGFYYPKTLTICITERSLKNQSTFSHELGHFFGLIHTHGPRDLSDELVDGSNSHNTGDMIMDTPADPNLRNLDKTYFNDCDYNGNLRDRNGDVYKPMGNNIMSYANIDCRDEFTPGQFARMRQYALYYNQILGIQPSKIQNNPNDLSTKLFWELALPPTLDFIIDKTRYKAQRPILVFFYHDSILWCKRMRKEIDRSPAIRRLIIEHYYNVGMNVSQFPDPRNLFNNDSFRGRENDPEFLYLFGLYQPEIIPIPGILILFRKNGDPSADLHIASTIPRYIPPDELVSHLERFKQLTQPIQAPNLKLRIRSKDVEDKP